MPTTYYTYVTDYLAPTLPAWSTTFPGYDGCSKRVLSHIAYTPQGASTGQPMSYEPLQVTRWKTPGLVKSGRRAGLIPPYRFTAYSVGSKTVKQYLVRTDKGSPGCNRWFQVGQVSKIGSTCTPQVANQWCEGPVYTTFHELAREFPLLDVYDKADILEGDVAAAMRDVRNELIEEASTAYDVLTDISEIGDIPRTIDTYAKDLTRLLVSLRSRHGKDVMRRAYRLTPRRLLRSTDKWLRRFGSDWMGYRYGIMPLVYSVLDIDKLLRRGQEVYTRKNRTITPRQTGTPLPPASTDYKLTDVTGSVTVRGEIYQFFTCHEMARLSGLGLNPLVTAWELLPYSFVIDWFVNVGQYIATNTTQNWAQMKWACISRRVQTTKTTYVHRYNRDQTIAITNRLPVNWWGSAPPSTPSIVIKNEEGLHLLDEEIEDSYTRELIPITGAELSFSPSLNWRRMIDSSVLSLNLLGRLVRSFNKK